MNQQLNSSIPELRQALDTKQFSAVELAQAFLDQAQATNPKTNAFITIDPEFTLKQAWHADTLIHQKQTFVLTGIPYCLKDAYLTQGLTTTSASRVLHQYQPPYSATVVNKLSHQGAVLIGKNNQDAWGHGGSSENTDFGPVKNPWNSTLTSGGSSGGTAAALASLAATFAIGEDTGGSIRNPASFNNISGLKVTYGRVSRYGAIAYASSLDTVGPMARNVQDLSLVLQAIAGYDPLDASSSRWAVPDYSASLNRSLRGKTLGIIKQYFGSGLDPQIKSALDEAISQFESLGVKIRSVSLPMAKYGVAIYYLIALSETSSNLARYDGVRYGQDRSHFTTETQRRIMLGTFSLSSGYYDAYYKKALQARTKLIRQFQEAFTQVDALIAPVMPFPPFRLGSPPSGNDSFTAMYLADLYTCATNPAGVPSLALPAGFTRDNLPIGMQLIGPMFAEASLLNFGHQYQQATDWHTHLPPIIKV